MDLRRKDLESQSPFVHVFAVTTTEQGDRSTQGFVQRLESSIGLQASTKNQIANRRVGKMELGVLSSHSNLQRSIARHQRKLMEEKVHPFLEHSKVYQKEKDHLHRHGIPG